MNESDVVERIIPAGTIVRLDNVPFEVVADTRIRGTEGNFGLVRTFVGSQFPFREPKKTRKKR